MTEDLQTQYPKALVAKEFTSEDDEHRSYLVLHQDEEPGRVPFVVQGDLLAAFDIPGPFIPVDEDKGHHHGHYIVETELYAHLPENVLDKVSFESESATFFAYAETREDAENLIEAIGQHILKRGEG